MTKDAWWWTSAPRPVSGVCLWSLTLQAESRELVRPDLDSVNNYWSVRVAHLDSTPVLEATSVSSMVMSVDHPGLTFNLTLVRSEPTYNQPVQQWMFTSDFAVSVHCAAPCIHPCDPTFLRLNAPPLTHAGEGLLWNLHSQTDSLHHSPEHGVHGSTCVQPSRASRLRPGHQVSTSTLLLRFLVLSEANSSYPLWDHLAFTPPIGEWPSGGGVQSEHSALPVVQEELVALWWLHGIRSGEWRCFFWRSGSLSSQSF